MVVIDTAKCTGCGTCAKICHEHCMAVVNKKISILYKNCSTCAQCAAICPSQALTWDGVQTNLFEPTLMPTSEQMDELLKERRTTRDFEQMPVDRKLLAEIANYAAYAPTHNHNLRLIIVDNREAIELMDRVLLRFTTRLYKLIFRPKLFQCLLRFTKPSMREEYDRAKPKIEAAINRARGFNSRPAAFVLIVGTKRVPLNLESAQYAVYNISLFAQVKGLGSRNLVGNQTIYNRDSTFRRRVGLRKTEKIFGLVGLGYPAIKFRNKVEGRTMHIQWINNDGMDN